MTLLPGGPVDFGDECLQHRRTGRHFGHGHAGVELRRNLRHARPDALGDVVAPRLALVFTDEVDLQVGDIRATAHEIVTHQAVEIEGCGGAHVNLVVSDLGLGADGGKRVPAGEVDSFLHPNMAADIAIAATAPRPTRVCCFMDGDFRKTKTAARRILPTPSRNLTG